MKHSLLKNMWLLVAALVLVFASCKEDDPEPETPSTLKTVFVYMPWTGNSGSLLSSFRTNLEDMKAALLATGLNRERVVVLLAETASSARMFELTVADGVCTEQPLQTYTNPSYTTSEGIATLLSDMKAFAPAESYSMIIGSHGMGWVHASTYNRLKPRRSAGMDFDERPSLTRFFGSATAGYQADVETLAEALTRSNLKMEYILFDDCYMSNVETAYSLKDVTHYLVGCTSEMMIYGMPYQTVFPYLLGNTNYSRVCEGLISFYNSYTIEGKAYPYATIGVTDCSQLEALAEVMKRVNEAHPYNAEAMDIASVQPLDGFKATYGTLFYDLGDYVRMLCTDDDALLAEFNAQLAQAVPYKAHTERFYSNTLSWLDGEDGTVEIKAFSGLSVSDPSDNRYASDKQTTAWWKATH